MSKNIYQDKRWKETRARYLKDKCELCGSTDRLSLHHKKRIMKLWEILAACAFYVKTGVQVKSVYDIIQGNDFLKKMPLDTYKGIENIALDIHKEQEDYYYSGEDTITICISCHYKIHRGKLEIPKERTQ